MNNLIDKNLLEKYNDLVKNDSLLPIKLTDFYKKKVIEEVEKIGIGGPLYKSVIPTMEKLTLKTSIETRDYVEEEKHMPVENVDYIIQKYDAMCDTAGITHLIHYGKDFSSSGHLYIVRIPGITTEQRNDIITCMAEHGIACNVHYKPLPLLTAYKNLGFDIKDFEKAYNHYKEEITLPLHTRLTDEEVDYIIENYIEIVKKYL